MVKLPFQVFARSGALFLAGWYPVVMAMGPPCLLFSTLLAQKLLSIWGDIESYSPEVSGFRTDLTGSLSVACHLPSFPLSFCDEDFPGNILLVAGHDWLYIASGGGVLVHLGLGTLKLGLNSRKMVGKTIVLGV